VQAVRQALVPRKEKEVRGLRVPVSEAEKLQLVLEDREPGEKEITADSPKFLNIERVFVFGPVTQSGKQRSRRVLGSYSQSKAIASRDE